MSEVAAQGMNTGAQASAMPARHVRALAYLAWRHRRPHRRHDPRGWRHPAHRFRPVHHRVATDHRRHPAADRGPLASGVRGLPEDPGIYRDQSRHEPRGVQIHLLVGMGASLPRALHRPRLPAAVHRLLDRRLHPAQAHAPAPWPIRPRRPARRARLVHGEKRARRPHRCQPVPARRPFRRGRPDLRLHAMASVWPRR